MAEDANGLEPTPPSSLDLPEDYSDFAPEDGQDPSTAKRKHQRGGRKASAAKPKIIKGKSVTRIPRLLPTDIPSDDRPEEEEEEENEDPPEEHLEEQKGVGESSKRTQTQPAPPSSEPNPIETGIRAFNLKKAKASGGQPVKIRSQKVKARKSKKQKKKDKKRAALDESDDSEESSSDEDEGKPDELSIRLGLNLVVEIFLKAKIKGDVTITFLQ